MSGGIGARVARRRRLLLLGALAAIAALAGWHWSPWASSPVEDPLHGSAHAIVPPTVAPPASDGTVQLEAQRPREGLRAADYARLGELVEAERPLDATTVLNLRDAALRGDLAAARLLYRASERCATGPRSDAELADRLHRLEEVDWGGPERLAERRADETRQYERCRAFASFPRGFRREILELAANAGDNEARREYYFERPIEPETDPLGVVAWTRFRERAAHYLHAALADGDAHALSLLSEAYQFGVLGPADPTAAYEYLFAYSLVARIPEDSPLSAQGYEPRLVAFRRQLDQEQIAAAESRARVLAAQCCGG